MESVDQSDVDLSKAVGGTQPEAQKPIPLTEDLKQIGVDTTHVVGSAFDELMSGKGGSSRDRVVAGKSWLRFLRNRFKVWK